MLMNLSRALAAILGTFPLSLDQYNFDVDSVLRPLCLFIIAHVCVCAAGSFVMRLCTSAALCTVRRRRQSLGCSFVRQCVYVRAC